MRAGNIDSRNFFLIHGTADTIVHEQHSLMLARALIDQGVGFRHQVNKLLFLRYKTLKQIFNFRIHRSTLMKVTICLVFSITCSKRLNGSLTKALDHSKVANGILQDFSRLNSECRKKLKNK